MHRSTPSQQLDNDAFPAHRRSNIPPGLRVVSADRLVSTKIRYLGRLFSTWQHHAIEGHARCSLCIPLLAPSTYRCPLSPSDGRQQMGEHFGRPPQIWKIAQPASQPALSEVCLTSVPCPIQPATRSESIRQSSPSPTTARCSTVTTLSRMAKAGRESSRRNLEGGREGGGRGLRAMRSADLQLQLPKTHASPNQGGGARRFCFSKRQTRVLGEFGANGMPRIAPKLWVRASRISLLCNGAFACKLALGD